MHVLLVSMSKTWVVGGFCLLDDPLPKGLTLLTDTLLELLLPRAEFETLYAWNDALPPN